MNKEKEELIKKVEEALVGWGKVGFMGAIGYKCKRVGKNKFIVHRKEGGEFLGRMGREEFIPLAINDGFDPTELLEEHDFLDHTEICQIKQPISSAGLEEVSVNVDGIRNK